jgi:two-component system cell cycle response regulator DivK
VAGRRRSREKSSPAGGEGRQPCIVVVDDYADNREMYAEYLRFLGYAVTTAADGAEALAKIVANPPDVVVLDLSLPKVDGWLVAKTLKADARTRHVPIIAVTGHALNGSEARARDAGADAYLIKPCLPEDLVAAVQKQLAQRKSA